jgi:hypothetical protein
VSQIHSSAVLRLRAALAGLSRGGSSGNAKFAILKAADSAR